MFKTKKISKTDREFAREIIDIFEEKLEELNITLPDKFKENKKSEARIFGNNYYDLEDEISEFISLNKRLLVT